MTRFAACTNDAASDARSSAAAATYFLPASRRDRVGQLRRWLAVFRRGLRLRVRDRLPARDRISMLFHRMAHSPEHIGESVVRVGRAVLGIWVRRSTVVY